MIKIPEKTNHVLLALAASKFTFHFSVRNYHEWNLKEGWFFAEEHEDLIPFLQELGFRYHTGLRHLPGTLECMYYTHLGNRENVAVEIVESAIFRERIEREFHVRFPVMETEVSAYNVLSHMLTPLESLIP